MLFPPAWSSPLITEDLPGSWPGWYMRTDSPLLNSLYSTTVCPVPTPPRELDVCCQPSQAKWRVGSYVYVWNVLIKTEQRATKIEGWRKYTHENEDRQVRRHKYLNEISTVLCVSLKDPRCDYMDQRSKGCKPRCQGLKNFGTLGDKFTYNMRWGKGMWGFGEPPNTNIFFIKALLG